MSHLRQNCMNCNAIKESLIEPYCVKCNEVLQAVRTEADEKKWGKGLYDWVKSNRLGAQRTQVGMAGKPDPRIAFDRIDQSQVEAFTKRSQDEEAERLQIYRDRFGL